MILWPFLNTMFWCTYHVAGNEYALWFVRCSNSHCKTSGDHCNRLARYKVFQVNFLHLELVFLFKIQSIWFVGPRLFHEGFSCVLGFRSLLIKHENKNYSWTLKIRFHFTFTFPGGKYWEYLLDWLGVLLNMLLYLMVQLADPFFHRCVCLSQILTDVKRSWSALSHYEGQLVDVYL